MINNSQYFIDNFKPNQWCDWRYKMRGIKKLAPILVCSTCIKHSTVEVHHLLRSFGMASDFLLAHLLTKRIVWMNLLEISFHFTFSKKWNWTRTAWKAFKWTERNWRWRYGPRGNNVVIYINWMNGCILLS